MEKASCFFRRRERKFFMGGRIEGGEGRLWVIMPEPVWRYFLREVETAVDIIDAKQRSGGRVLGGGGRRVREERFWIVVKEVEGKGRSWIM